MCGQWSSSDVVGRSWDWMGDSGTLKDGEVVDEMSQKRDRAIEQELSSGSLLEKLIAIMQSQCGYRQQRSIHLRNMQDSFELY